MYNNKRCVLVADDEARMVRALSDFLTINNFHVLTAKDGKEALDVFYSHNSHVDILLLDVMMPELDGFAVLEDIRDNCSMVPVIMVSAKGEDYDQVKGLNCGADDYVSKPFSPSLLLARIESVLKRVGKSTESEVTHGAITVHSSKRVAFCNNEPLELTKREFDLLLFFMTNHDHTFSREQLLNSVWGYDFDGELRTVDTHIKQLRLKLGEHSECIKTIHRVGYKFQG